MAMTPADSSTYPTIVSRFGYSPLDPAIWRTDPQSGLQYRDLGLRGASELAFAGMHFRAAGQVQRVPLVKAGAQFAFLFVLAGRVALIGEGAPVELKPLDAATRYGGGGDVLLELSHEAELLVFASTGEGLPAFGEGGGGQWSVCREAEDTYVAGEGPRSFFRYRNLGVDKVTGRRIHIHVVRATGAPDPGGTGNHSHSMGQLFYVLRGWADLVVKHRPAVRMWAGDAMCLAARMDHDVPDYSPDYLVLEMCIPADYDTVDQPLDEGPLLG
jgi:hypothetical protein